MLVAQASAADTVWVLAPAGGLELATQVAIVLIATLLLLVLLILLIALLQLRKGVSALQGVVGRLEPSSHAIMERARGISENVEAITRSVRGDVNTITGSIEALTARLHQASDRMEERIEDFNALMEVVQEEAEDIFVGTASTVRGVRRSAATLSAAVETPSLPEPIEAEQTDAE
ncbi:MAG: hypothetical protein R3E10_00485 [Gemmatimonadota bacterium]